MSKFTGQLYNLPSKSKLIIGAYVKVNGPHDTFGVVQEITPKEDGTFLNRIRGVQERPGVKVVAVF